MHTALNHSQTALGAGAVERMLGFSLAAFLNAHDHLNDVFGGDMINHRTKAGCSMQMCLKHSLGGMSDGPQTHLKPGLQTYSLCSGLFPEAAAYLGLWGSFKPANLDPSLLGADSTPQGLVHVDGTLSGKGRSKNQTSGKGKGRQE